MEVACTNPISDELCSSLVFMTAGPDVGLLNTTRLDVYTTNAPAGTSLKNMLHWTQLVNSGRFQTFDYGDPATNFVHYGQTTPVAFNLRKIRVPVHLFLSDFDWLSTREDVEEFLLPNLRKTLAEVVRLPRFSHLDYIWGLTSGREIYAPIIESIKQLDGFQ
ncbi:AB hydrolase-1 domain-containing protein [Aphelenchoides fujianensis]|nr:AB hydrolase-1 domain-containing protein [Aphelenchoides fujianensis]